MIDLNKIQKIWGLENLTLVKDYKAKGNRIVHLYDSKTGKKILKGFDTSYEETQIDKNTKALDFLSRSETKYSPFIINTTEGKNYDKVDGLFFYLLEYIEGDTLDEIPEDQYLLGETLAGLHSLTGYTIESGINIKERINNMYSRFERFDFKAEYDAIIDSLPDFDSLTQCFIHSDITPLNAMKTKYDKIILIDFDEAGIGSLYIDLGYPLITQCVRYQDDGQIKFNREIAKAFYDGYFSYSTLDRTKKELIFYGAVFMQLMYMPLFGEENVPGMWAILDFAMKNKEELLSVI